MSQMQRAILSMALLNLAMSSQRSMTPFPPAPTVSMCVSVSVSRLVSVSVSVFANGYHSGPSALKWCCGCGCGCWWCSDIKESVVKLTQIRICMYTCIILCMSPEILFGAKDSVVKLSVVSASGQVKRASMYPCIAMEKPKMCPACAQH